MDVEPIYCAEQIVVPVDLADILKAYTKEVIRRQPGDLLEFSAKYFTNLANVAASVNEAPAPSQEQLRVFYQRSGGGAVVTPEQIHALAAQVGIAKAVVAKVLQVGRFESAVDADRFLFLLLVMSCESFAAVLQGIFNVFGDKIPSEKFRLLISYLAPDMDPDVTTLFLNELSSQLIDITNLTYDVAVTLPVFQPKL